MLKRTRFNFTLMFVVLACHFASAALPLFQDDQFKRIDKTTFTLWPSIPFFPEGDLDQYQKTMQQDRDSVRRMFMGELIESLELLADKGGIVEAMLEPMANILMMFDQVHDSHKASDVLNVDKTLEAQFKATFDEQYRQHDVRDYDRKLQFSKGTDKNRLETYIHQLSTTHSLGKKITKDELNSQVARELFNQIDYVAYGTFSNLGGGAFQVTLHLTSSKSGVQRSYRAKGNLVAAVDTLAKQVFDEFQKNIYPDWATPDHQLAWLPIPNNRNKSEGFSWEEAYAYCKNRGYRLPYARELLMAESGGDYKPGGIANLEMKVSYPVADQRLTLDNYVLTPGNEAATGGPIQGATYTMQKGKFWCVKGAASAEVKIFETVWSLIRTHGRDREIYRALLTVRQHLGDFGVEASTFFNDGTSIVKLERYESIDEALRVLKKRGLILKLPARP